MVVLLIVLFVVAVLIGAFFAPPTPRARTKPIAPVEPTAYDDPIALATSDPVEALLRYGTPETAEQLRAQGIDLAALGYREGGEA